LGGATAEKAFDTIGQSGAVRTGQSRFPPGAETWLEILMAHGVDVPRLPPARRLGCK
jgi:hypothetical protein